MAGTIVADAWKNGDGTENFKCRAWVNFNGSGTVAIRASGNVSSITDGGTGYYTVNFTTAMQDANYSCSMCTEGYNYGASSVTSSTLNTTSSLNMQTFSKDTNAYVDFQFCTVSVFR